MFKGEKKELNCILNRMHIHLLNNHLLKELYARIYSRLRGCIGEKILNTPTAL